MKVIHNSPVLREWLRRHKHTSAHVNADQFHFDEEEFSKASAQVSHQHPNMNVANIELRAAHLLLDEGASGKKTIPQHVNLHKVPLGWVVAAILAVLLIFTLIAKAEPDPRVEALKANHIFAAPQTGGVIVQLANGGSTLATRGGGLVIWKCSTGMSCSFSGNTFTMTASGVASGCTPAASAGYILQDDGAGGCTSSANFTWDSGNNRLLIGGVLGQSTALTQWFDSSLTQLANVNADGSVQSPYFYNFVSNPSTTGVLRLAKTDVIGWRNNANSANLSLGIDTSNRIAFSTVTLAAAALAGTGSTTCTNQFFTVISATAAPTCTGATLASAQFANQGTTTTVLHGNGAGNPSFAAVSLSADVTGQLPIGNVGSAGLSGTAPMAIASTGAISITGAAGQVLAGSTPAFTATPALGTDNSVAGTLTLANSAANAHTIWSSAATTTNTIAGFAAAPTTTDIVICTVASTTCTLTDSGIAVASNKIAISAIGTAGLSGTSPIAISAAGAISCSTCTITIASGTSALATGAITSGACATVVTTSATGTATTDNIMADFNADPTGVTGYAPSANGMLTIIKYPTANNVNFKVCNNTASSVTPGAITLNWRVVR